MTAAEIIAQLELLPHPEGGHYRRIYEGERIGGRPRMTSIYYLLEQGQTSHWHRIDADELWHHYVGAPLALTTWLPGRPPITRILGTAIASEQVPQLLVPARHWQTARTLGSYTLVGATVSPGFCFEGFELAPPDFAPE